METEEISNEETLKKCPYCAEDIKVEAIKCKHCGSTLTDNEKPLKTDLGQMIKRGQLAGAIFVGVICIIMLSLLIYILY